MNDKELMGNKQATIESNGLLTYFLLRRSLAEKCSFENIWEPTLIVVLGATRRNPKRGIFFLLTFTGYIKVILNKKQKSECRIPTQFLSR